MFSNEQEIISFLIKCDTNNIRVKHIEIKNDEIIAIDIK